MDEIKTENEQVRIPHLPRQKLEESIRREFEARRLRIDTDFTEGFEFINSIRNPVTVFGSARFTSDHPYYQKAREVGALLANERYTVVTGGAGGIMEAANRGAFEAGGESIGMNIMLPHEQNVNKYVTRAMNFRYFFSRKVFLAFSSQAVICFPGGFGTLDELFEILTLVQTRRMPHVPIILFGKDFWKDLDSFLKTYMVDHLKTIDTDDPGLYTVTDDLSVIRAILNTSTYNNLNSAFSPTFYEIK